MIPLTVDEITAATGGRPVAAGGTVTGLTVDSRAVRPGDLFAALPGEHVDGTRFAAAALAAGATAALVPTGADVPAELPRVEVDDVLAALGAVARVVRDRSAATVLGVTGSSGKTSTKDLLAGILEGHRHTVASERSYNNELGLPLTVGRLEHSTEALVLEMGMRGRGHIARLCEIARPDVAVLTNVGLAHVGLLGSREAIAAAKSELPRALPADGLAVLNADDPLVRRMADVTAADVLFYSVRGSANAAVRAEHVRLGPGGLPRFRLVLPGGSADVTLSIPGEHMVANALAAAAAATRLGLGADEIAAGLAAARLSPMRLQVVERSDGVTIMNDAYNANPDSATAGLKTLRAARRPGSRALAVIGDMTELGEIARAEHERLGRLVVRLGLDRVVGVGEHGRFVAEAARLEGVWEPADAMPVDTPEEALAALGPLNPGDVVLVKASRAAGLERVADALLANPTDPDPGRGHPSEPDPQEEVASR